MELKQQDPNIYTIKPLSGNGPLCAVNWWQLFGFQKSPGDNLSDQAPETNLPVMLAKKTPEKKALQVSHPYGTKSKIKVNSTALQLSSEDEFKVNSTAVESSSEDEGSFGVIGKMFNHITTKLWQ